MKNRRGSDSPSGILLKGNKMNLMNLATLSLSLLVAAPAFADSTAIANAGATSSAGALANGNSLNANLNLNGGPASASAQTGPVSVGQNVGAVTVTPSLKTGAVTNQTQTNLTIQGGVPPKIPVGVPGAVVPQAPMPQIFGGLNQPTTVTGIPLILEYLDACKPVATRGNELEDVFAEGASGKTKIIFSPDQDYKNKRTVIVTKQQVWGGTVSDSAVQQVESVAAGFPEKAGRYTCLGVLTVVAKKGAHDVPFTTVLSDARIYPLRQMEGFKNVVLVSVKESIAAALGVTTAGSGFSVSPGLSAAAANVLTLGTLGAGYSNGSGGTYSAARIGDTFLVLSPATGSDGVMIDPAQIRGVYHPTVSAAGENGKKLEATK